MIDPGLKRGFNYWVAKVGELVGTRQSGFVLEIFEQPPKASKRGIKYRLLQTEVEEDKLEEKADERQGRVTRITRAGQ